MARLIPHSPCQRVASLYFAHFRYNFRLGRRRNKGQLPIAKSAWNNLLAPPQVGGFYDTDGFNGRPPGTAVLLAAWYASFEGKELWLHRSQQLVGGVNVAGDESHKLVKAVRVDNNKVFHGVFTLVNEYNQVVLQVSTMLKQRRVKLERSCML